MKKYVFLDFDGVLNTERYHSVLVNSRETCSDPYGPLFDPVAVGNLRRIVEETEAEVVICSSWKLEGADRMAEMWRSRKMPGTLAGCTPEAICGRNLLNVSHKDKNSDLGLLHLTPEESLRVVFGPDKGNEITI